MVVYSFSQINLYEQCPRKYQYRYLDKVEKEFESSPDLILGTSVHGALEWLYEQVNIFRIPIKAELIGKFHDLWNNGIAEAGDALIYKGEQQEQDYIRRGEEYLKSYYDSHAPFDQIKVIETELMLHFELQSKEENGGEQKFRGIIDRLDKEGNYFVINDYKTNKHLPPEEKEEYREQLTLYALGIQQKYGKYCSGIKARLHYLHFGITDEREITPEILAPVVEKYRNTINRVEANRFDYNMGVPNAFPTQQNPFCKYCEYQQICPLWKHLYYEDEQIEGCELSEKSIQKLVDRYVEIGTQATELTKEKDGIKEILVSYTEKNELEQIFGEKNAIKISESATYSPKDKSAFKKFLEENELLEDAMDIPYYKISALIKDGKLTSNQIKEYLETKPSWRLTACKKKE